MSRLLRLAGVLVVAGMLAAAAGAGWLAWRVQRGPLPLDFLIPRVVASLVPDGEGWTVGLDALELAWQPERRQPELRARGLRIAHADASVELEAVRIRLRRRALFRGEVVVTAIELDGPALQLVRDADGRYAFGVGAEGGESRDVGWLSSVLGRLHHVAVRNGRIRFRDDAAGRTWTLPHVDGAAWRSDDWLRVQLDTRLAVGAVPIALWLDATYGIAAGTLSLDAWSSGGATRAAFDAWPSTLAPEAHAWVTSRLTEGRIGESVLALSARVLRDDGARVVVDALDARVPFDGLTVRYLDTMPPATGVGGVAAFSRDAVAIAVATGRLEALAIERSAVHVVWPPGAPNRIAIDARTSGPLAGLVAVLEREPVALRRRAPVPERGVAGSAATRVRLAFPLAGRPALGKLGLHATSTITDAVLPDVAGAHDLSDGACVVVVDDRTVAIDGTARLGDVPVRIAFRDRLRSSQHRRLEIGARLEPTHRAALGLPGGDWLTGPVDARLRLSPDVTGRTVGDLDVDLAPAALDLPALALRKPPGAPGLGLGRLRIDGDRVAEVERFAVDAGGVRVRGNAARGASGAWDRIDASAEMAVGDGTEWGAMTLALRARDEPRWGMTLASPDLGRLLRAYGYEHATGGSLRLDGTVDLVEDVPFDGALTVEKVTLTQVPWLVKAVSLASLRGLLDAGSDQAIVVDRAVATIAHRPPDRIELRDAVARGPKLGLTLSGTLDRTADTIDVEGTLVPSYYMLNEGVSSIPVVGGLLDRATGGALQAVTFTARGARADPVVAVQPLSSLAPGVVRDWLRKLGL